MHVGSKTLGENVCFLVSRGYKLHRHVLLFDQVVEPRRSRGKMSRSSPACQKLLSELNYSRIVAIGNVGRLGQDDLIQLAIKTQGKVVSPP